MGTEYSVYNDYELEESIPSPNETWEMFTGQKKKTKAKVTVFVHEKRKQEKKKKSKLRNQKYMKVLRHPAVLKYHASYEDSNEVYLITEPVIPLDMVIETLDANEIIAGLFNIVQALDFLHEKCGLSHNGVSLSSIYVSSIDSSWKLGGMENVCKHSELTSQFLDATKDTRDSKSLSPEEKEGKVHLTEDTGHSLDSYAFGILVGDILDCRTDLGKNGEKFWEKMQSQFLHIDPKMRPKFSSLFEDEFFSNVFLEVLTFLSTITVKSDIEKEKFFSTLVLKLKSFPPELVAKRLLLRLLSKFVLAEPSAIRDFLPHILTPLPDSNELNEKMKGLNPILPENIFKESGVPILLKLFSLKDSHVRLVLLQFFGLFVKSFDQEDLKDFVLPQLLLGLRDTDDTMVAATLRALSALVAVLGGATVVGGMREKIFTESRPKFSASTTICEDVMIENLTYDKSSKVTNISSECQRSETVSDVINLGTRLTQTDEKTVQPSKEQRRLNSEKRRHEMEKKREERKREREIQKLEKENHKQAFVNVNEKDETRKIGTSNKENTWKNDSDSESWVDFDDSGRLNSPPHETDDQKQFDVADLDFAQTHAYNEQNSFREESSSCISQRGLLSINSTEENQREQKITTPPLLDDARTDTLENESWESKNELSSNNSSQCEPRRSGKALKLGAKKKVTDKTSKKGVNNSSSLGSEFEIPAVSVKSSVPDFFADMEPTIDLRTFEAPGHRRTAFNNKLSVVDETSQVESGWDDEAWEDFN